MTQSLASVIRQIVAVLVSVYGVLSASVSALHLPPAVSAVLTAFGPILLSIEHFVADPSTGSTPSTPTPPATTSVPTAPAASVVAPTLPGTPAAPVPVPSLTVAPEQQAPAPTVVGSGTALNAPAAL